MKEQIKQLMSECGFDKHSWRQRMIKLTEEVIELLEAKLLSTKAEESYELADVYIICTSMALKAEEEIRTLGLDPQLIIAAKIEVVREKYSCSKPA